MEPDDIRILANRALDFEMRVKETDLLLDTP